MLFNNLIQSKTYKAKQKEASEIILDSIELPSGTIKEEVEKTFRSAADKAAAQETLKKAYDTLKVAHHLSRAHEFYKCIAQASDDVAQRLKFYTKSELQSVIKWVEESHVTDHEFKGHLDCLLSTLDTPSFRNPIDITLNKQCKNAENLFLITDLYRDFDDWLTLIHTVMSGKYKNISLITSNEIEGRCAQVTQSYLSHLTALAKSLHGYELTINLYQGLAAFDFSCFHEDHAEPYLGVHYPTKMYAAMMRAPALDSSTEKKNFFQYTDFQQHVASLKEGFVDVICIGKVADLDLALMLGYDAGISFHNVTILGGRPNTLSTNTNCPAYHVLNLPSDMIMLDSSYGQERDFKISKEKILARSSSTLTNANPVEAYLDRMLTFLDESKNEDFKMIARLTLQHLEQLQYDKGNTFDVFTLCVDEHLDEEHPTQVFFASKDLAQDPIMFNDESKVEGTVIKSLSVFYPKESIKNNFVRELEKLTDSLIYPKRKAKMPLDLEKIHRKFPLINHYGDFRETPIERSYRTLTEQDEYRLIIRSLLILDVLSHPSLDDASVASILCEGFPGSDFGFDEKPTKPANMIPNIQYLRTLLTELSLESVQLAYVSHDLGKCRSFVSEHGLSPLRKPEAAAHDDYLKIYLEKDNALRDLFSNEKLMNFVKILDLLGHSPYKLQALGPFASLKMVAKTAIFIKNYGEKVKIEHLELRTATRHAILELLINQAEVLELDTSTLSSINPELGFTSLEANQQHEIAFIMWTGALRLLGPSDHLNGFKDAWNKREHQLQVREMVALLMDNLEQTDGKYCFLYNVTGLIHKTDIRIGLKGFFGKIDDGGMGGTMEDIVRVLFPFILREVSPKLSDSEAIELAKVSHNEFQVQQLIEMVHNLLPDLAGLTRGEDNYIMVDFGSLTMNQALANFYEQMQRRVLSRVGFFEDEADLGSSESKSEEIDHPLIKKPKI